MNKRYEMQYVGGLEPHFRITDTNGDNRIGTCYDKDNAFLIVQALNNANEAYKSAQLADRKKTLAEEINFCKEAAEAAIRAAIVTVLRSYREDTGFIVDRIRIDTVTTTRMGEPIDAAVTKVRILHVEDHS